MAVELGDSEVKRPVRKKVKSVPPDGGWGWMVLLGTAITNVRKIIVIYIF